jgi:hypothetical protein
MSPHCEKRCAACKDCLGRGFHHISCLCRGLCCGLPCSNAVLPSFCWSTGGGRSRSWLGIARRSTPLRSRAAALGCHAATCAQLRSTCRPAATGGSQGTRHVLRLRAGRCRRWAAPWLDGEALLLGAAPDVGAAPQPAGAHHVLALQGARSAVVRPGCVRGTRRGRAWAGAPAARLAPAAHPMRTWLRAQRVLSVTSAATTWVTPSPTSRTHCAPSCTRHARGWVWRHAGVVWAARGGPSGGG